MTLDISYRVRVLSSKTQSRWVTYCDRPIRSSSTRPSFARRSGFSGNSPTRRTESVLRYQTPLGKTGIILRLKAPLKQRKLVKFELRF